MSQAKSASSASDKSTATTKKTTEAKNATVESTQENKPIVAKDIDLYQFIPVKNGFHGMLVYVNKRTGEEFIWNRFGDEQDIQLVDLRNAKSSARGFFENNYFMFDDDYAWVIDYLGVSRYYKDAIRVDEFDDLFTKSASEVEKTVSKLSSGQKRSVAYRALQLISEGEIDSNKVILALEKALGIELTEK